jgi:hypothetical protein
MLRTRLQLPRIQRRDVRERAGGVELCAAHDGVSLRVLGAVRAVFPAGARVEEDALAFPFLGGGGGPCGGDDADAVGEEGHAEGGARVEMLADEEVAVIEGGGEGYDGLKRS